MYNRRVMLIYLDMCCLKRPYDDQSQPRIRLETEAVLALLALESDTIAFVRSTPLLLENAANPIPERAARVNQWLSAVARWRSPDAAAFEGRVASLLGQGLKMFDALHVATAELSGAKLFVTTDDRLLGTLRRIQSDLRVRVSSPIECVQEMSR
jgi:predicted nucleic acid-binding protein